MGGVCMKGQKKKQTEELPEGAPNVITLQTWSTRPTYKNIVDDITKCSDSDITESPQTASKLVGKEPNALMRRMMLGKGDLLTKFFHRKRTKQDEMTDVFKVGVFMIKTMKDTVEALSEYSGYRYYCSLWLSAAAFSLLCYIDIQNVKKRPGRLPFFAMKISLAKDSGTKVQSMSSTTKKSMASTALNAISLTSRNLDEGNASFAESEEETKKVEDVVKNIADWVKSDIQAYPVNAQERQNLYDGLCSYLEHFGSEWADFVNGGLRETDKQQHSYTYFKLKENAVDTTLLPTKGADKPAMSERMAHLSQPNEADEEEGLDSVHDFTCFMTNTFNCLKQLCEFETGDSTEDTDWTTIIKSIFKTGALAKDGYQGGDLMRADLEKLRSLDLDFARLKPHIKMTKLFKKWMANKVSDKAFFDKAEIRIDQVGQLSHSDKIRLVFDASLQNWYNGLGGK